MDAMGAMGGIAMDDAAAMAGAGRSLAGFGVFVIAWAVMMAAMLFPAAAPMIFLFQATAVFVAGYLLVWTTIGGITWLLVQVASDVAGQRGAANRQIWAPLALGTVLVETGL